MRRVLITGSRDWEGEELQYIIVGAFINIGLEYSDGPITLVSGACPTGADRFCEKVARSMGWEVETHPADWKQHGKRAGFVRNSHMVSLGADVCLAFILNKSKGALMTERLARKAGIPTRVFEETS